MTDQEKSILMNGLYGVIFDAISKYETRGFNAHSRTQRISEGVLKECEEWIELVTSHERVRQNEELRCLRWVCKGSKSSGGKMNVDHISSDKIRQDILDTEVEIRDAAREAEAFNMLGDRWSIMRADARLDTNRRRVEFVEKLRAILVERGEL